MMKITPDPDAYGSDARISAFADILEVDALRKPSISLDELADYIRDNRWTRLFKDKFVSPGGDEFGDVANLGEAIEASESAALEIFDLLRERERSLADEYPYRIQSKRLVFRDTFDLRHPYILLLGVTVAHAYALEMGFDPTRHFEHLVSFCLEQKGLIVVNFASVRRESSDFKEAVEEVGRRFGFPATVANSVYRKAAQDAGVDVIAHLDWQDRRPFHWVYIVQATCSKSEHWPGKMAEPAPGKWKDFLALRVLPRPVLAVPHHIPHLAALDLIDGSSGQCLLMDRLRLCRFNGTTGHLGWASDLTALLGDLEVSFGQS